mmetsp:Transcript_42634/g.134234  ORF Transcript_42634/g.134234 Transcript_42634/m.134234 type:complete len:441 (-) Transcript_42634:81-1403(-)
MLEFGVLQDLVGYGDRVCQELVGLLLSQVQLSRRIVCNGYEKNDTASYPRNLHARVGSLLDRPRVRHHRASSSQAWSAQSSSGISPPPVVFRPSQELNLPWEDRSISEVDKGIATAVNVVESALGILWDRVSTAVEVIQTGIEGGSQVHPTGATTIAAHPSLPFFISGGSDGPLLLWGFGTPQPLAAVAPVSSSAISKVRFDPSGRFVAVADYTGLCGIYELDFSLSLSSSDMQPMRPLELLHTQSKRTYDMAFINSGSLIVTGGHGSNAAVRVWDLLRPSTNSCIAALNLPEGGCNSMVHVAQEGVLVAGGHKGDVCLISSDSWTPLVTVPAAHRASIRAIVAAPVQTKDGMMIVTGGNDGDMKLWSIGQMLRGNQGCLETLENAHEKATFMRAGSSGAIVPGTYGVLDVISTGTHLLSCGGDGRVVRRAWIASQLRKL